MTRRELLALAASGALPAGKPAAQPHSPAPGGWEPIGLSGGGAMFAPAISPADPMRMVVNCDMSAAYVSHDGGRNWRMIHWSQLHSSTRCRPAWHPTDPLVVFAADGSQGLKISRDGGISWTRAGGDALPADLNGAIAIDPGNPRLMLAGGGDRVYRSDNGGHTWTVCSGPRGRQLGFHFDQTSPTSRRTAFAAVTDAIWRSIDGGITWQAVSQPPQSSEFLAFAGGSNAGKRACILYCSVTGTDRDGKYAGGILSSADRGQTWRSAMGAGLNMETRAFDEWAMGPVAQYVQVLTSDADPRRVYAFNTSTGVPPPHAATCYRSDDAGETWRSTFQADPRYPGMNAQPDYTVLADGQFYEDVPRVAICPADPDRLIWLDDGRCYTTENGGKTWLCGHTRMVPGTGAPGKPPRWICNGLVVTTTWNYYVDPFQRSRHTICYTDIGFARSMDRGQTWEWWERRGRSPWANTCYELAFDPDTPGLVWGAFSNTHDIPNANIIYNRHRSNLPGGVCVTRDFGATWGRSNEGLPLLPVTSIVVNPKSLRESRTLYAGVFGAGVYRSEDGGKTWAAQNAGLGDPADQRVDRVILHRDGALFALVTALRKDGKFVPAGVGLYRWDSSAHQWRWINRSQPLLWPKDFTLDAHDSRTIYLSACDTSDQEEGGLYRTRDGGQTWRRLARKGPEHFGAYPHPSRPGWIYMTLTESAPGAGLWLSKDDGATWAPMMGLPFSNAQRVAFDPESPDLIYVTTFGGSVWRGEA